ncbi:WW domain-binding protein 4 [Manduca sexta]|uniref:WW domain-binding protein 4 n=1 Tax=Manduca sexta TaxID=7130 RepID=A0A922CY93_MANSE|nr:WW domain-binding protein 4 [Manduca sexta]KAG6462456.1 hypothetical protein O3G_MSEX013275 [Manduca sexta]
MTEYWKSQARKYCEFCKCWFADNKVSISFHENGKRHKENVQKHISQLSKKSAKEFKQKAKVDEDIKKMETAAMAAYLKDVQSNADITSQSIRDIIEKEGGAEATIIVKSGSSHSQQKITDPIWHEVKNEDGSLYYWNTITNETTWDTPDEYLSIAEQEKKKLKEAEKKKKVEKLKLAKQNEAIKEVNAHLAREKMKEFAVNKNDPPSTKNTVDYGPAPRAAKPYGAWTPIVNKPEENIDLQLPKANKEVVPPPVVVQPEIIQFKEKHVGSLGEGPVEFKRRKFNNAKRNARQKLDDD